MNRDGISLFSSYGTNAGGPANAGGAPSSSRKMQATKAQVDEVRDSQKSWHKTREFVRRFLH